MGPVPSLKHSSMQAPTMLVLLLQQMGMMERMPRRPEPKTFGCEKPCLQFLRVSTLGTSSIPAVPSATITYCFVGSYHKP